MSTTHAALPPTNPSPKPASGTGPAPSKPQGYWEYSQSKGTMTHVSPGGTRKLVGTGYSGFGPALDDPAAQDEGNKGPIPRGAWTIGPQQNHQLTDGKGTLRGAMKLSPGPGNKTGRTNFWIHGDTAAHNHTASQGCIVLPRSARDEIAGSGDIDLQVVYP